MSRVAFAVRLLADCNASESESKETSGSGSLEHQRGLVARGTWAAEIRGGTSLPWTEVTSHKGHHAGNWSNNAQNSPGTKPDGSALSSSIVEIGTTVGALSLTTDVIRLSQTRFESEHMGAFSTSSSRFRAQTWLSQTKALQTPSRGPTLRPSDTSGNVGDAYLRDVRLVNEVLAG